MPHSSDLVVGHFFYFVVAIPHSAAPFTLKADEFSVATLQHSIAVTFRSAHISTGVLHSIFFAANLKVLVPFCHVNCMSKWNRRELISIVE